MDEKDLQMCQLLFLNSRMPIRDLADALDISVQAAHRRLINLAETGVIKKFTANISLSHLGIIQYCVGGKSKIQTFDDIIEVLSTSDRTFMAIYTSGNYLFIQAFFKEMEDLEPYLALVKEKVQMKRPFIGIGGRQKFGESDFKSKVSGELKRMDYQIIKALHDNSRKTIAEISLEVGASQKTVRKRLDRMIENNLIEFSIQWMPEASTGVTSLIFFKVKDGKDNRSIQNWFRQKYGSRFMMCLGYLDHPDVLMLLTWSSTAKDHDELIEMLNSHEDIEWVRSHLTMRQHYFRNWRDDLLMERIK